MYSDMRDKHYPYPYYILNGVDIYPYSSKYKYGTEYGSNNLYPLTSLTTNAPAYFAHMHPKNYGWQMMEPRFELLILYSK